MCNVSLTRPLKLIEWNPKTPYIKALKKAEKKQRFKIFLQQREEYRGSPSFFFDCAMFFFKNNEQVLAKRILTSVLDIDLENPQLIRIVAHTLTEWKEYEMAIDLFKKISKIRPEEPQSFRDLALVQIRDNKFTEAMTNLHKVVTGSWDSRFPEIQMIALTEYNALLKKEKSLQRTVSLDSDFEKTLDLDLRIVLHWDADLTDVDLWVIEPSGEKCFYSHNRSKIGGRISRDFTRGYGPEEYLLRKAMAGTYKIKAKYYGSSQQKQVGPCTLRAVLYTNYGRPNEKHREITLRLEKVKDIVDLGEITIGVK